MYSAIHKIDGNAKNLVSFGDAQLLSWLFGFHVFTNKITNLLHLPCISVPNIYGIFFIYQVLF